MKTGKLFYLVILFMVVNSIAYSQIQVAVKTIKKEFARQEGGWLILEAFKAKIVVRGWDKEVTQMELKLVARHPSKQLALKELSYHQFSSTVTSRGLELKNQITIPVSNSVVSSKLNVEYTLFVPKHIKLIVNNSYGSVLLEDVFGEVDCTLKFSPLRVSGMKGSLKAFTYYSDTEESNFDGDMKLTSQKSDHVVYQSSGTCTIKSEYGKLILFPGNVSGISIASQKTEVRIFVHNIDVYRLDLATTYSEIEIPDRIKKEVVKKDGKTVFKFNNEQMPMIQVATSLSDIHINEL